MPAAVRRIEECEGVSTEEALDTLLVAIRDFNVHCQLRNIKADRPKYYYSQDMTYDRMMPNLKAKDVDVDQSLIRFRQQGDFPSYYQTEIYRSDLDKWWPSKNVAAQDRDVTPDNSNKHPEQSPGEQNEPPQNVTPQQKRTAETTAKYERFYDLSKELKGQNRSYGKTVTPDSL